MTSLIGAQRRPVEGRCWGSWRRHWLQEVSAVFAVPCLVSSCTIIATAHIAGPGANLIVLVVQQSLTTVVWLAGCSRLTNVIPHAILGCLVVPCSADASRTWPSRSGSGRRSYCSCRCCFGQCRGIVLGSSAFRDTGVGALRQATARATIIASTILADHADFCTVPKLCTREDASEIGDLLIHLIVQRKGLTCSGTPLPSSGT